MANPFDVLNSLGSASKVLVDKGLNDFSDWYDDTFPGYSPGSNMGFAPGDVPFGVGPSMSANGSPQEGAVLPSGSSSAASVPEYLDMGNFGQAYDLSKLSPDKAFDHYETILGRMYSTAEREASQAFNSAEAKAAFDRELQADSTKYQRLVSDLRAAGVNPMLAFGSGSATASGVNSAAASASGGSSSAASSHSNSASKIATAFASIAKVIAALA